MQGKHPRNIFQPLHPSEAAIPATNSRNSKEMGCQNKIFVQLAYFVTLYMGAYASNCKVKKSDTDSLTAANAELADNPLAVALDSADLEQN